MDYSNTKKLELLTKKEESIPSDTTKDFETMLKEYGLEEAYWGFHFPLSVDSYKKIKNRILLAHFIVMRLCALGNQSKNVEDSLIFLKKAHHILISELSSSELCEQEIYIHFNRDKMYIQERIAFFLKRKKQLKKKANKKKGKKKEKQSKKILLLNDTETLIDHDALYLSSYTS